jgi:maltooligosyltrehalose synthase
MRSRGEARLVIAVPRLVHRLYRDGAADWGATTLALPAGSWRNVLTAGRLDGDAEVPVSRLLADFPVAVLRGENDARATAETGSGVNVAAEGCTARPL